MTAIRIKARLLQENDGQSESLAVRRTSFLFDIHNCVLREFLIELERLFVNDLSPFMVNKEEYHIQLKGISDDGEEMVLDCDAALQDCLQRANKSSFLRIFMTVQRDQLRTNGDGFPVAGNMEQMLSGMRYTVDSKGPFPHDKPHTETVTKPTGAGLIAVTLECDVVVAGGGSAGIGAALAAARTGAKTVCIHGRSVLGGNASSEVKLHMVGADRQGGRGVQLQTEAREGGICEEIRLDNSMAKPQFCAEMLDLTFLDKFRAEPNLTLLLNTWFTGVKKDSNTGEILAAYAESQLSQKHFEITAKVFIDCTGDGRLGVEAGCQWTQGREAKSQYNESLAVDVADTLTEGTSLAFHARDMGKPMPFKPPPTFSRKFTAEDFKYRSISCVDYGFWWIEMSYPYDTVSDNETIMQQLLEAVVGIWDYIKNTAVKIHNTDTTNWALDWFGTYACKREARRMIGLHVQTQKDLIPEPTDWSDAVCHGGWPIDLHNPSGINDPAHPPFTSIATPYIYGTPLRCFVSGNVPNLMFAGRLASFSHVAFGSQRVMATCMVHGQAAGTAAAYAVLASKTPKEVCQSPENVWSIQQQLLRDDQFVMHQINQDPRDMALKATVSATSEQEGSEAKQVISGQTRAVYGKGGCMSGQCLTGSNRWISNGLPASITLQWNSPMTIETVELVFDSGLHRLFTFTTKKEDQDHMVWGKPMPETVKDYIIEVQSPTTNGWVTVVDIKDNYLRKRIHELKLTSQHSALRVTVTATNGIENAHICEIRVYPQGQTGKFPKKSSVLITREGKEEPGEPIIRLATPTQPQEWYTGPDIPIA